MSNNGRFSGELSKDSPQLFGLLKRHFPDHLGLLCQIFKECFERGGCADSLIKREVGVSFNPRAARLATILIQDGKVLERDLVGTVMQMAISPAEQNARLLPILQLVQDIDTLRHLHMTELSENAIKELLTEIELRATIYSTELNSRLYSLFIGTLDRCKKKFQ